MSIDIVVDIDVCIGIAVFKDYIDVLFQPSLLVR